MARAYTQPIAESAPLRMSYQAWEAWYGTDDLNRGEWVQGEVTLAMPPLVGHANIVDLLHFLISLFVRRRRLGRVYSESLELWLPKSQAARLPDVVFIATAHADRLTSHRLEGYADLVVEVVSAESATRDRRQKLMEYEMAGIPEYWVLDPRPRSREVLFHALDSRGRYQRIPPDAAGRLHSRVLPGFWLNPDWLWQEPLPDPEVLLQDILAGAEG